MIHQINKMNFQNHSSQKKKINNLKNNNIKDKKNMNKNKNKNKKMKLLIK